jgi:hypothetical protein
MNKYPFLFDYVYFRHTQFSLKFNRVPGFGSMIGESAITTITLVEIFLLADFLELIFISFRRGISMQSIFPMNYLLSVTAILIVILMIINSNRYRGKYYTLKDHWKGESKEARFWKGAGVIVVIFLPVALFAALMKARSW